MHAMAVMAFTPLAASARRAGACGWQAEFAGYADHALDLHSATSLPHVRFWHKCEVPTVPGNVCY
jgi:hypothetical protein